MMVYTKNLILVCTGRDTTKAASLGMPVLQLCLGISQSGALQRLKVSAVQRHCLLGVTDPPQAINFCSAERIAADLVYSIPWYFFTAYSYTADVTFYDLVTGNLVARPEGSFNESDYHF